VPVEISRYQPALVVPVPVEISRYQPALVVPVPVEISRYQPAHWWFLKPLGGVGPPPSMWCE